MHFALLASDLGALKTQQGQTHCCFAMQFALHFVLGLLCKATLHDSCMHLLMAVLDRSDILHSDCPQQDSCLLEGQPWCVKFAANE